MLSYSSSTKVNSLGSVAKDGSYQRIIGIGPENKIIDKDGKT